MGAGIWRRKDDNRTARPAHTPLPHPQDRQRQLSLQGQLRSSNENHKGGHNIDQNVTTDKQ